MFSLGAIAAKVGLNTLKRQIITGLVVAAVIIVPVTVKMTINSWKSDIKDAATGEITNAVKDGKIKTLEEGKEVDEKILNSDDDVLCALLGGCLQSNSETSSDGGSDGTLRRSGDDPDQTGNERISPQE